MNRTSTIAGLVLGCAFAGSAAADGFEFDTGNMYAGGGISNNKISGVSAETGFQFFGGYNFGELFGVEKLDFLVEAGYYDSGYEFCTEFNIFFECVARDDISGIWSTGGVAYRFSEQLSFHGRAGIDLTSDADGFMYGGGAGFHLMPELELRGELVIRTGTPSGVSDLRSIQINAAYSF